MDIFNKKKIEDLESYVHCLELESEHLNEKLKSFEKVTQFLTEEIDPREPQKRRQYMADVSVFYQMYGKNLIEKMKADQLIALSLCGREKSEYDFNRACINVLNLFEDWFERCCIEHQGDVTSYQEGVNN
jgi:hypothetical protein